MEVIFFCARSVMFVLMLFFGYVLLLFVLYLIMFYRILPHTLSPSFWYSGAYALELAYATRTRGPLAGVWGSPPSSPLVLCIYVLLVYCVKHLLYCIVQIFCTNILPSCILFSVVPVGIPSIDYFLHLNLFVFILS